MDWISKLVRVLDQEENSVEGRAGRGQRRVIRGPPEYTDPADFEITDTFTRGEETTHKIEIDEDETIIIQIDDVTYRPLRVTLSEDPSPKAFWTAIHYLREYEAPGVWKEQLMVGDEMYRLGALYCMGPFDLTIRETRYDKYGEHPYEP